MSKSSVTVSFWLPTQALLLILGYGVFTNLPWWITWFPTLITCIIIGIILIIVGIALIATWISGHFL